MRSWPDRETTAALGNFVHKHHRDHLARGVVRGREQAAAGARLLWELSVNTTSTFRQLYGLADEQGHLLSHTGMGGYLVEEKRFGTDSIT
tara:strand:+ start:40 stop:309 length:270 start_codon:yes stop_codon:yes gene_type:complete